MSDFGDVTWPKGRKDYRCEWCGQSIPAGEQHAHFAGQWEGEWQDWRMHRECYESAQHADVGTDGFMPYDNERPIQFSPLPAEKEPTR